MISKKGSTTVGATKGYGLAKGFGSNHNTLLGFFKAKLIRTPLGLNEQWNRRVNKCRNTDDLFFLASNEGTDIELLGLYRAMKSKGL